jgi:ABC-2 type transport system ATP-binding protein
MELVIDKLSKTYANGVQALKAVSLTIPTGLFGLLGPNGAGKSTLMRTIATLQEPDSGSIRLGPLDVLKDQTKVRRQLGYLPQEFGVYPRITAWRMLDHIARLKGVANAGERKEVVGALLQQVNLFGDRNKHLGTFSGGMKQRFGIAQALIGDPRLLITDEPTAGLDPAERNRFYNLLSRLGEQTTVILSTHIVEDVYTLCHRFAIINEGQVLYQGSPETAVANLQGKIYMRPIAPGDLKKYQNHYQVISVQLRAGRPHIRVIAASDPGQGFTPSAANLEDAYFSHFQPIVNHV